MIYILINVKLDSFQFEIQGRPFLLNTLLGDIIGLEMLTLWVSWRD